MAVDVWPRETGHTLLGSTGALERKISVAYSELLTCCRLHLVGGPLATLKFASDFLTLIFSLPLDRLYKPLSFDFLELQLLREPLGVVLVL